MKPVEQSKARLEAMPDSLRLSLEVVFMGDKIAEEFFERGTSETLYEHLARTGQADLVRRLHVFYSSR